MTNQTSQVSSFKASANKVMTNIQMGVIQVYLANIEFALNRLIENNKAVWVNEKSNTRITAEVGIARLMLDGKFNLQLSVKIKLGHIEEIHNFFSKSYEISHIDSVWLSRFLMIEVMDFGHHFHQIVAGYVVADGQTMNIRERFKLNL